jgi:2,3-bisphosphoglycerate-independent phosphoglycerate mutase
MSVVLFFVDGLGIGKRGPQNPFDGLRDAQPLAVFQGEEPELIHGGVLVRTDACLGVEGRPQSASGQTTILTGINVPAQLGYHKQGFPNEPMRNIIREHSIFLRLKDAGVSPLVFTNAYPRLNSEPRPRWISATTAAVLAAGMSFRDLEDLKMGRAIYQDFTNRLLIERGDDLEPRTPEEAGQVLANIASVHRFTLYEYFITDKVGHAQEMQLAREVLASLARFLRALLARLDLKTTTLLLTSDHGNIEDLSTRTHTLNQVPTLIWGKHQERVARRVNSLADITPAILEVLTEKAAAH